MRFLDTDDLKTGEIFLRLAKKTPADGEKQLVPAYHFTICRTLDGQAVGECNLRIGHNDRLYYGGNIGYRVDEPYRGNHYAGKACLLLFKLAEKHGMKTLIITCNPENRASARTCEYTGAVLEEIARLPEDHDMYQRGERQVCIYRITLNAQKVQKGPTH